MAGAGAGADQGPGVPQTPGEAGPGGPRPGSDWAGLPADLLVKVAGTLVAQTEAGWAARLKGQGFLEEQIQWRMEEREADGNCPLFMFARVCKGWRKAQLKVRGPLRIRIISDVIAPGSVALVKWALAERCPRETEWPHTMATVAAVHGHREQVQWMCGKGGFAMDERVMREAAGSGNLQLVQWLRGEGCFWDYTTCNCAVIYRHVEMLRWVRKHGAPWTAEIRDRAAETLGYTDDLGNLVNAWGNPIQ